MYVDQWPTFCDPVIQIYIWKTFSWRNVGLKILIQCDIKFDLQIYMLVSDLYFVVQWYCLLLSIRFDEQASFFGYWFWYGPLTCISSLPCAGVRNDNIHHLQPLTSDQLSADLIIWKTLSLKYFPNFPLVKIHLTSIDQGHIVINQAGHDGRSCNYSPF